MHIGIIGTGNMGTILTEALINGDAISEKNISITNRTIEKAYRLKKLYPCIQVEKGVESLVRKSDIIFICIKPLDIHPVLTKMKDILTKNQCVVSITSPISVEQLESIIPCSCVRAIPSITNRALSGVCLLTYGEHCTTYWKEKTIQLLNHIGSPITIEQNITRIASDIVSCGPAFFSFLLQKFIEAAVKETKINQELATKLASDMLIGMAMLISQDFYTFPELQEKVTVKGGITGEGIKVLEESAVEDIFRKIFRATQEKFDEEIKNIKNQFEFHNV